MRVLWSWCGPTTRWFGAPSVSLAVARSSTRATASWRPSTRCRRRCAAAADIQRRFAHYNAEAPESLNVRIGIHAGEPVSEHNDLFGATVQLAARLCSEAEAGGVVVSGLVREMCGQDTDSFVPLGERRLKGFAEAVPIFRFAWRGVPA